MASPPVVPLPVLVERVDLHPPSGVGHRAGRGPRPSGPGTVSRKGGRPQTGNAGTSVPPLAAAEPRRRSHGPLPGPSPGPPPSLAASSSALLSRPSERGRPAAPTGTRSTAQPTGPPFTQGGGSVHNPAPASTMTSAEPLPAPPPPQAAAAAMFSFLVPGPAAAAGGSAPLLPLKASEADEVALPGRLGTPLATQEPLALLRSRLPYSAASSVFLTEPKPPPS